MIFGMRVAKILALGMTLLVIGDESFAGTARMAAKDPFPILTHQSQEIKTLEELFQILKTSHPQQSGFREHYHSDILTEPLVRTGTLKFNPPDQLEKHVQTPHQESFIIKGDRLHYINIADGIDRSFLLSDYPPLQVFVDGLRAMFSGDNTVLSQFYRIQLRGTKSQWMLTIVPKNDEMRDIVRSIVVQGRQHELTAIVTYESSGNHTNLEFTRTPP